MLRQMAAMIVLAGFAIQPAMAESATTDHAKRWQNREHKKNLLGLFKEYNSSSEKPVLKTRPVKLKTVKKTRKTRRKTARRKARPDIGKWWKTTGNPAVFAFRDCTADFASRQYSQGSSLSYGDVITRAMNSQCQPQFANMAKVLVKGLGQGKSDKIIRELAKSTFLPAVKKVAVRLASSNKATGKPSLTIEQTKTAMLSCFIENADRMSASKIADSEYIANQTLGNCRQFSDRFFAELFARYPGNQQLQQARKDQALNLAYKTAIIKRVDIIRKGETARTASRP